MQILLRQPNGKTVCAQVQPHDRLQEILQSQKVIHAEYWDRLGESTAVLRTEGLVNMQISLDEIFVVFEGRALGVHQTVHACGLRSNATICLQGRLRGGKPVKVTIKAGPAFFTRDKSACTESPRTSRLNFKLCKSLHL